MTEHQLTFRVRYAETDQMGFVHHANYFVYFEMGRVELLRASGCDYRDFERQGFFLVVAKLGAKFRAPAKYDDQLTLTTRIARITPVRVEHEYRLTRDGQLLVEAESTLACVDRAGHLQALPAELRPAE